jgi:hypothetical protein
MKLTSQREVNNTKAKLARLEERYEALRKDEWEDRELRDATLTSLKRYINQFTEEIACYEAHHAVRG